MSRKPEIVVSVISGSSQTKAGEPMADLKYYDGTQWVTLKGSGVALSTVGVAMTDCDLTPDGANGSFTPDGTEADGTQKYKLDLNLPRGTVVTTSASEPPSSGRCVGDLWLDTST